MLSLDWTTFKTTVAAVGVPFRYYSLNSSYYIFSSDGFDIISCTIDKDGGADQVNFETYYQALAATYNVSPLAPGSYSNITGNGTTVVKSGPGALMGLLINNNNSGGTVVIYDNTAASGIKIVTVEIGSPSGGLLSSSGCNGPSGWSALNLKFSTGLTVVTSGSSSNNITVIYR